MSTKSRRQFLKHATSLAAAGLATSLFSQQSTKEKITSRLIKNVIFILGDDHSAEILGCYGNQIVRTPNLDRMAYKGVRFSNFFVNAPLCSASRQSLLTGKYPHATGVTLLQTSFPEEQLTLAEHLKNFGFKTGIIGKTHFNNNLPHGFDYQVSHADWQKHLRENPPQQPPAEVKIRPQWKPFQDHARTWLNSEVLPSQYFDADETATFYTNKAIEFIRANKENRFCLWVGFQEPHSPFNFPIEFAGKYKPEDMPLPKGSPEDDRWIPTVFKDLTDEEKKGIVAAYYTSVEYLDRKIGQILRELERQQLTPETLVVYVGDNGYLLGDHKRFEKYTMWEQSVRVPCILQVCNRYGQGRKIELLAEGVDLVPTVLDILNVEQMPDIQGKSLFPLLTGRTTTHKDYVFSEYLVDNMVMIRNKEWKYVFTSGQHDLGQGYATGLPPSGIFHRLYNLRTDPGETTNLAANPNYQPVLEKLQAELLHIFQKTHPRAKELPEGLSVEEQLVWFCEPTDKGANLEAK